MPKTGLKKLYEDEMPLPDGEHLALPKLTREKTIQYFEQEIEYYAAHTSGQYKAHVGDYLDFVGENRDWRDRDVVYNYLQKQKKRGVSQQHINYLVRGPLGALFRAHKLRIPVKLPRFSGPQVDLTARVAFEPEEVYKLIEVSKSRSNWAGIMALSTTWGLRVEEIHQLRPKDFDVKDRSIMIYTRKGGMPRRHMVPEEVLPWLKDYGFPECTMNELYYAFNEMSKKAGVTRIKRKVYHAIRHTVLTQLLLNGCKEVTAKYFLRWKISGIVGVYFTPKMVDVDQEVLKFHPFISCWKGNNEGGDVD